MNFVDIIGDAVATGLPTESAETVLMSQVLEHLEDPLAALREANRLLVAEGHLILSTDFAWHQHEAPRDFFRFSPFGLEYLLQASGFVLVSQKPVCGTWLTICQEVAYGLRRLAARHFVLGLPALMLGHFAQAVGVVMDRVSFDSALASGFVVVGRKVARTTRAREESELGLQWALTNRA
jgi:Methyltransferase domain.